VGMDADYDDPGPDDTLSPSESLDSDEVRNNDGDTVVDPPDQWIEAEVDQTLDEKLAAEVPDVVPAGEPDEDRPTQQTLGQVSGTPEDGDSFFNVVDEDEKQAVPGDDEADSIIQD
jgi:hypothetical protein